MALRQVFLTQSSLCFERVTEDLIRFFRQGFHLFFQFFHAKLTLDHEFEQLLFRFGGLRILILARGDIRLDADEKNDLPRFVHDRRDAKLRPVFRAVFLFVLYFADKRLLVDRDRLPHRFIELFRHLVPPHRAGFLTDDLIRGIARIRLCRFVRVHDIPMHIGDNDVIAQGFQSGSKGCDLGLEFLAVVWIVHTIGSTWENLLVAIITSLYDRLVFPENKGFALRVVHFFS